MSKLLEILRLRLKIRFFGKEWQFATGNPLAEKVIFQLAITIPIIFGLDFEIFI